MPATELTTYLYGHSAGAQFAGRYAIRHPDRLRAAVLSAPGRYAFPDPAAPWPYGQKAVTVRANPSETPRVIRPDPGGWRKAAALPITVVVGTADTEPQPSRPGHPGTTRTEFARHWVEAYTDTIGLDILQEFDGITFLKVSDGYGGHTQIIGLFHESMPVPFPKDPREPVRLEQTSLHHFALEIDKADFDAELERLRSLGVEVTTFEHRWCRWRSLYVRDPEGNILELVCYDATITAAAT